MSTFIRQARPDDMPAVHELCRAYRDLLIERHRGISDVAENYYKEDVFQDLLDRLPELHSRPDGAIFVGGLDGEVLACAMTHRIDDATCEIKRVFVADAARGQGLGRLLFEEAMALARADGYRRMVLDTMVVLTEAIALYKALGFSLIPGFYELDPQYSENIVFYGIDL
ncbi:MAG: GNAT family N-acetyltransferase [Rhodobacter sp.]|nr:GNAT family N-acetyltransferase [Rhodobacter sp.]